MIFSEESTTPGRVFTHNEGLDFIAVVQGLKPRQFTEFFGELLDEEIKNSNTLEGIAFGITPTRLFRTSVHVRDFVL